MNFRGKFRAIFIVFIIAIEDDIQASSEEFVFNGTHHLPLNHSKIEVTTVKIAEVINLQVNSSNTTLVLKEKTAKHFLSTTTSSKVVLIPPAKIDSQIVRKKNVHKS